MNITGLRLQAQEQIILATRQYLPSLAGRLLLSAGLVLLPCFLLVPLINWRPWGWWLLGGLVILALLVVGRTWRRWRGTMLVITNQRVVDIDQRGVWERVVSEAPLERVSDVHFSQRGLAGTLLRYGTVEYTITPGGTKIVSTPLRDPQKVGQIMMQAATPTTADGLATISSPAELVEWLKHMRATLGPADFTKILGQVDPNYWRYRVARAKLKRRATGDSGVKE